MAKTWTKKADIEAAIDTMIAFNKTTGSVPNLLLTANNHSIMAAGNSHPGLVQFFYQRLAEKCPELLKFFN